MTKEKKSEGMTAPVVTPAPVAKTVAAPAKKASNPISRLGAYAHPKKKR